MNSLMELSSNSSSAHLKSPRGRDANAEHGKGDRLYHWKNNVRTKNFVQINLKPSYGGIPCYEDTIPPAIFG
jgi:hypothetical protein